MAKISDELVDLEAHSAKPQDLEILRQQIAEYDRVIAGKRRDLDNLLQLFNKDLAMENDYAD